MSAPPAVPFWFSPWMEMFKAFGLPTTLVAFYLLQNAGLIPSQTDEVLQRVVRLEENIATLNRARAELDRTQIEALRVVAEELKRNGRIARAICATWGREQSIREACLQ